MENDKGSQDLPPLSEREREILQLVATGASNQEIAARLFISINTVKVHLRNIFAKLGVASRTEATMVAVRRGWVDVPRAQAEAAYLTAENTAAVPAPAPLPDLPRWPAISGAKRTLLVAAVVLAVVMLFLPQLLTARANRRNPNPISGVFPTPTVIAGANASRWRGRTQMPTPRNGLAVVAHGGLIYAMAGVGDEGVTGSVEAYNPKADTWSFRRAKPTPVGFVSAAVVGQEILVPGGVGAEQQVRDVLEVYDPAQDTWASRASLPAPLAGYALAVFDGKLYLFGGLDEQGYVSSVYCYDPQLDRWETRRPMPRAAGLLAAAVLRDRIYVVGGYNEGTESNACDVYDPASDSWAACTPMSLKRGGLSLVAVRDSLYALGGGMETYLAFNERYDSRAGTWIRIETPVTEQWRGLGAAFLDPYIYAMGGWSGGNLDVNEAYQALFYQLIIIP